MEKEVQKKTAKRNKKKTYIKQSYYKILGLWPQPIKL